MPKKKTQRVMPSPAVPRQVPPLWLPVPGYWCQVTTRGPLEVRSIVRLSHLGRRVGGRSLELQTSNRVAVRRQGPFGKSVRSMRSAVQLRREAIEAWKAQNGL